MDTLITKEIVEEKKPDRRVIKTKRAICNAFASLLAKKNFNDITIKEVADLADVNRKTVYNYYSGIHEILDDIENQVVNAYANAVRSFNFREEIKNPYKLFENLTLILNNNIDFYSSLLKLETNSKLSQKIISNLKNKVCDELRNQNLFPEDKLDFIVSFVISGMIAAYQSWFNSDRERTLLEFSQDMGKVVLQGVLAFRLK